MQPIRSLIAIDDQAHFRNDVQLDLFDDAQENLALLKSYMFTIAAPGNTAISAAKQVSSVELLNQLLEAFVNSRGENRFVAIANYGHGKSHLALALANYFSKPVASEEVKLIQNKLAHVINDSAKSSRFHDFKQERGEFLIVRLRGDTPSTLREQFIPSLERALRAHQATKHIMPSLWHEYAEKVLTSLNADEINKANEWLATVRLDVPTLIEQVCQRKDVRDYCIQALTAAKNMAPDLGAQLSLRETIEWVADNICGTGKPLAGMLVMFDEFSLYVSRYAQRGAVGELQDLLNGVSNRPTKVVFLAFAQHDPVTIADNAPLSDHGRDTLKHELTRIPKKLALYTLMESVIDAYLRQREMAWLEFTQDKHIALALEQASHVAYEAFLTRYTSLQWSPDKFDDTVTKGCFPLHPLTTALLCNLKFSTAGSMSDPRTVLGFVMEHLSVKMEESTIVNGAINWVRPISLVNYFGESISPEIYRLYQNARRSLSHDADETQRDILMALFLLEAIQTTLSKEAQLAFIVESTGLIASAVSKALGTLADNNAIRYDTIKKTYSFWPADADPGKLDRLLRAKLEKIPFDLTALQKLNQKLGLIYGYGNIPLNNLRWGHPEDWAANQAVLTREYFESDYIRALVKPFAALSYGIEDGNRGLVVWLLARHEEDVIWYRENAEVILDKALNRDTVPPVIAMLAKEPMFDLIAAFRRSLALQGLSQNERSGVGTIVFDHEMQQTDRTITNELTRFIGNREHYFDTLRATSLVITPIAFRAVILSHPKLTLKNMLSTAYELAYRTAPREFFPQYRSTTQGNLRTAVKQVAGILFTGQTEGLASSISTNAVARDLCEKYIMKWGLLSSEFILQPPTDQRLRQAWNLLDSKFTPGTKEQPIVPPLIELLNPPHGYDYNTVTLLFAAWVGYHIQDLELRSPGKILPATSFSEFLQKGTREFLQNCKIENVALTRRNLNDVRVEVRTIIERTSSNPFTEEEAEAVLVKLENFHNDMRNNSREREEAISKATAIREALEAAKQYNKKAGEIQSQVENGQFYQAMLTAYETLKQLQSLTLVKTNAAEPRVLRESVLDGLERTVYSDCRTLEKPEQNKYVGLNEGKLTSMQNRLKRAGLTQFDPRIQEAMNTLKETEQKLQKRQSEEGVRAEIEDVDPAGSLNYLKDKAKRLEQLTEYSPEILNLRDEKLEYITHTISGLEGQVEQIQSEIDTASDEQTIDSLRDRLLMVSGRFQDTPYQITIQEALGQVSKLREFFQEVKQLQRQSIQTPNEGDALLQKCAALRSQYASVLAPTQMTLADELQESVCHKLTTKQKEALDWLQSCADTFQRGGNINLVADKLSKPPSFLPANATPELESLRLRVQEHIDKDALLKVEKAFRDIADRKRQEECIQRLTQIMNERPNIFRAFWSKKG